MHEIIRYPHSNSKGAMDILIPLGEYFEDIPGNKMDFFTVLYRS